VLKPGARTTKTGAESARGPALFNVTDKIAAVAALVAEAHAYEKAKNETAKPHAWSEKRTRLSNF